MTRVLQQTERPMAAVQLTVFKSEADYFEAEVPVCSAGSGVFLDRVHLQWSVPWDVWLILLSGAIDLKRAAYQPPDKNLLKKSMRAEL